MARFEWAKLGVVEPDPYLAGGDTVATIVSELSGQPCAHRIGEMARQVRGDTVESRARSFCARLAGYLDYTGNQEAGNAVYSILTDDPLHGDQVRHMQATIDALLAERTNLLSELSRRQ